MYDERLFPTPNKSRSSDNAFALEWVMLQHGVLTVSRQRLVKKRQKWGHSRCNSVLYSHYTWELANDWKIDLQNVSTESSTPRIYGHTIGLPALSRPSTVHTRFVMIPALSPSVQISARLSFLGNVAHCQICTHKKLPSTCVSPSKLLFRWRRYTVRPWIVKKTRRGHSFVEQVLTHHQSL